MNYKKNKWNHFNISFLETFDEEVPIYSPSVYKDYRGEIFTTYHSTDHPVNSILKFSLNVHNRFSKSYSGVLRGLHYDDKTWKLVQSTIGDIYLVVLDTRKNSMHYGKWESYILSEKTRDQVLIPPGFANGHYALTDCIFHYTLFYENEYIDETKQKVIKWNDKTFNIEWPTKDPILQKRDQD
jgi:dTDP-4-dehydrorhamnose 3,5-epimerase